MDSNISNKTFSHKFLRLRFIKENATISLKHLLKQKLCSIINLYQHIAKLSLDPQFLATSLEQKIFLLESSTDSRSSTIKIDSNKSTPQLTPIVYGCSIALVLAPYSSVPSRTIAEKLSELLNFEHDIIVNKTYFKFYIKINKHGLINFYLDSQSLANWLQQLLVLVNKNSIKRNLTTVHQLKSTPKNLFSTQYIHSRCCSLLSLATTEYSFKNSAWQLSQPESITWLDSQNNLCLTDLAEFYLLCQLLIATDSFASESANWHKLALNLSYAVAIFIAECRFIRTINQNHQKAIARLALIAISKYYLEKILVEKLNIVAPVSL